MATIITNSAELAPGWYAVGMKNLAGDIEWGGALLAKYIGDGRWENEDGEDVNGVYAPVCGFRVCINDADGYVRQ